MEKIKTLVLGVVLGWCTIQSSAQIKPTADSCLIIFKLTNNQLQPYAYRNVLFRNRATGDVRCMATDSLGSALVLLPKNVDFDVDVLSGSVAVGSYELTTPAHNGLIKFSYDVSLDIFDEDREGEVFVTGNFSTEHNLQPTDSLALVHVSLTSKDKVPISASTVLFRDSLTREVFVGQTGQEGQFDLLLPVHRAFGIRLVDGGSRMPISSIVAEPGREYTVALEYDYSEESSYTETFFKPVDQSADSSDLFVLSNVLFDFDKAVLKPMAYPNLNAVADCIKKRRYAEVEVSGHTDSIGDDAYNKVLSEKRANAVMNYLIEMGIDSRKIHAEGKGESCPVASNDTDEGRQQNRRTEIRLIAEKVK